MGGTRKDKRREQLEWKLKVITALVGLITAIIKLLTELIDWMKR